MADHEPGEGPTDRLLDPLLPPSAAPVAEAEAGDAPLPVSYGSGDFSPEGPSPGQAEVSRVAALARAAGLGGAQADGGDDDGDDAVAAVALAENGVAESLAELRPLLASQVEAESLGALRVLDVAVTHLGESGFAQALAKPDWIERIQEACAAHDSVRRLASIKLLEWVRRLERALPSEADTFTALYSAQCEDCAEAAGQGGGGGAGGGGAAAAAEPQAQPQAPAQPSPQTQRQSPTPQQGHYPQQAAQHSYAHLSPSQIQQQFVAAQQQQVQAQAQQAARLRPGQPPPLQMQQQGQRVLVRANDGLHYEFFLPAGQPLPPGLQVAPEAQAALNAAGTPMSEEAQLELALAASREPQTQRSLPAEDEDAAELLRAIKLSQDPGEQVTRSYSEEDPVQVVLALSQLEHEREQLARERDTLRLEREASAAAAKPSSPRGGGEAGSLPSMLARLSMSGCVEMSPSDVQIVGRVGRGGFGEVLRGKWKGTDVALKRLWLTDAGTLDLEAFEREAAVLASLRHPNVVLLMGVCRTAPADLSLVMEFCPKGSLSKLLHERDMALSMRQRVRFAMLAARGMVFLHDHDPPVIHRDLKPANLLVTADMSIKVCDFGLSRTLHGAKGRVSSTSQGPLGTPHYAAPEILSGQGFDHTVDNWAFGVVLWEILERTRPFNDMSPMQLQAAIALGEPPVKLQLSAGVDTRLQELVDGCMSYDAEMRPNFEHILAALTAVYEDLVRVERQELAAKKGAKAAEAAAGDEKAAPASPEAGAPASPQPAPSPALASTPPTSPPLAEPKAQAGTRETSDTALDAALARARSAVLQETL